MTNRSLKCQIECQLVGVKESTYLILFGYNNYILHVSTCYIYVWSCFATVSSNFTGGQFAQGVQAHHPPPEIQPCYIGHSTTAHGPGSSHRGSWCFQIQSHSKNDQKWSSKLDDQSIDEIWSHMTYDHMKHLKQPRFFCAGQTRNENAPLCTSHSA